MSHDNPIPGWSQETLIQSPRELKGGWKRVSTEVVLAMPHNNPILGYGNAVDQEPAAAPGQQQDRAPEAGCGTMPEESWRQQRAQ